MLMIWIPYRTIFRHRSRWSHGLIFGTLFRVIYFLGITTLTAFAGASAYAFLTSGDVPNFAAFVRGWESGGILFNSSSAVEVILAIFAGMWTGAASHTLTDIAITYIKTGRVDALL